MKIKLHSSLIVLTLLAGVHPALAQPTLSIAPAGNQSLLFWPATATSYFLQRNTNLVSPDWEPVPDAVPVTVNNAINVTVTNTASAMFFRLFNTTAGMALIPAGAFTMGDNLDGLANATPTATVYVSAFYMDVNLVSYHQWQTVYNWATNHGYRFNKPGSGQATNHPVQTLTWYDSVKWCNARSQQAGLTPVYYTDAGLTQIYTNGETDAVYPNWATNGYRLPTEAEREKAARGGLSGQRFPWGNAIDESLANYQGDTAFSFDSGPNGYNAAFTNEPTPDTSPVGYFAANGYGLYDMAGNVEEWCWDWYAPPPYPTGSPYLGGSDPRGSASGSSRVLRGGSWNFHATVSRCAYRDYGGPANSANNLGFRCVKGL